MISIGVYVDEVIAEELYEVYKEVLAVEVHDDVIRSGGVEHCEKLPVGE